MTDTIAAVATPPGAGGIGIIRISGSGALGVLERLFRPASRAFAGFRPWRLHRGRLENAGGEVLDDALVVFMPGPNSFTGEDVAELHCHGGPVLLATLLEEVLHPAGGVRLAERGEFTRRAFLNGRMDLAQAEAVAEMIAAPTREGARLAANRLHGVLGQRIDDLRQRLEALRASLCLAVDFPEEEVEAFAPAGFDAALDALDAALERLLAGFERTRCWREGVVAALAGPVNVGKSSLMNALLGRERAIVTPVPGTTRDFLEEPVCLAGLMVRLVDTAGLRPTPDAVEAEGIRLGRERVAEADVIFLLVDGAATDETDPAESDRLAALVEPWGAARTILIWNKADRARPREACFFPRLEVAARVVVSARTGEGLETLAATARAVALAGSHEPEPGEAVPNLRQARQLERAREALRALKQDLHAGIPCDVCAVTLESAARALGDVVGLDTPDDVLNRIFASFCIGK